MLICEMKLRNGRGREMRTRKIQKQAFAVCLAIMTAAQTMTGYGATITAGAAPDHGSWVREQMEALQRAGSIRHPAGIIWIRIPEL